jgi:hypothetical protein
MISKTGRCLCGNIRYSYTGAVVWTAHCHCESCRRNTSSPVTTFFAVPLEGFSFSGETGAYQSSPGVTRRFCINCGTPMSYENEELPGEIHLYAASLDEHGDFAPQRHDFWNERVPWLNIADPLPKLEE